jgi:hypothetical protein
MSSSDMTAAPPDIENAPFGSSTRPTTERSTVCSTQLPSSSLAPSSTSTGRSYRTSSPTETSSRSATDSGSAISPVDAGNVPLVATKGWKAGSLPVAIAGRPTCRAPFASVTYTCASPSRARTLSTARSSSRSAPVSGDEE